MKITHQYWKVLFYLLSFIGLFLFTQTGFAEKKIQDQTDRWINVPNDPQKICILSWPALSVLSVLEPNIDRIAAVDSFYYHELTQGFLGNVVRPAAHLHSIAFSPDHRNYNFESVLKTQPDLIFLSENDHNIDPFSKMGISTFAIKNSHQDHFLPLMSAISEIMGKKDRSKQIIDWYQQEKQQLDTSISAIPEENRPSVIALFHFQNSFFVAGNDVSFSQHIEIAGGRNNAKTISDWSIVSKEQIMDWNPDVILVNTAFDTSWDYHDFKKDPILSMLKAVENKTIYRIPRGAFHWENATAESPLFWHWLHNVLYPEGKSFSEYKQKLSDVYQFLYNYTLSEQEQEQILHTQLNQYSKFYQSH